MNTIVQACTVAEVFDNPWSAVLIAEYAEECANALIGKPAPRRDAYENMERSGLGQAFAAYEDGVLVGFAMLLIAVVPHFDLSCATTESLFVTRAAHCGLVLLDTLDAHAKKAGCISIFYTAPVGSRFARLLALRVERYQATNVVYCRRLA